MLAARPRARPPWLRLSLLFLLFVLSSYRIDGWAFIGGGGLPPPSLANNALYPPPRRKTPAPPAPPALPPLFCRGRLSATVAVAAAASSSSTSASTSTTSSSSSSSSFSSHTDNDDSDSITTTTIELTDWMSEGEELWQGEPNFRRKTREEKEAEAAAATAAAVEKALLRKPIPSSSTSMAPTQDQQQQQQQQQLPVKLQREVNLVWYEIQQDDRMSYLPEEDRARLKQQLVILAFFRTLFEHPGQILNNQSAEDCFRQADVNRDGQLSFEEFLKWYRRSHEDEAEATRSSTTTAAASSPPPSPSRSSSSPPQSPTSKKKTNNKLSSTTTTTTTSLTLRNKNSNLEKAAMKDFLRQFLADKHRQDKSSTKKRSTNPNDNTNGDKSEEEVLEDLDRIIETAQVLLELEADVDTLLAALATHFLGLESSSSSSSSSSSPQEGTDTRLEKLAVVKAQCGPIVHQIVQDSARLGGLFQPPPEVTQFRRDARQYQAMLDLDHHNAQLAREYLMAANSDARAFVVHMAGLVYALRNQYRIPVSDRHLLALESLQLYVPVAHALGLGSRLKEMEELSYKALFPESYERFASWHKNFADLGQVALLVARERIAAQIEGFEGLRRHLEGYEIHGRVKSVVSAFKKVYRKDKLPEELHDMLGLRIILRPALVGNDRNVYGGSSSSSSSSSSSRFLLRGKRSRGGNALPVQSSAEGPAMEGVEVMVVMEEGEGENEWRSSASSSSSSSANGKEEEWMHLPEGIDLEAWLCHRVHDVVLSLWEEVPGRYKNYVDQPKSNGYRSIHDGVYLMDGGGTAEIQIRTEAMHYEAEEGVASHALYKAELQTVDQVEQFQQQLGGNGNTYGNGRGGWAATTSQSTTKVMKQTLLLPSVAGSTAAGAGGGSAASAAAPEP